MFSAVDPHLRCLMRCEMRTGPSAIAAFAFRCVCGVGAAGSDAALPASLVPSTPFAALPAETRRSTPQVRHASCRTADIWSWLHDGIKFSRNMLHRGVWKVT